MMHSLKMLGTEGKDLSLYLLFLHSTETSGESLSVSQSCSDSMTMPSHGIAIAADDEEEESII